MKTYKEIVIEKSKMEVKQVDKKYYLSELSKLATDKRAYLDEDVVADKYYLVFDVVEGKGKLPIGGFGIKGKSYITGLFSNAKGKGKAIFEMSLDILKKSKAKDITLFCIGDFLKKLYMSYGFKVDEVIKWDDKYAPKNWDYKKYGRPDLYEMSLKN